jgi:hypothetical protein
MFGRPSALNDQFAVRASSRWSKSAKTCYFLPRRCSCGLIMRYHAGALATRDSRLAISNLVQRHLDENGIARKELIRDHLSKSAIDKFFRGEYSHRTLAKIEGILGRSFAHGVAMDAQAPEALGGYSFQSVKHLQGTYLYVRPMFNGSSNLSAYLIEIQWNESRGCLTFEERERIDSNYKQAGVVYIPLQLPFFNLVTIERGDIRTILLGFPEGDLCRGITSTISRPKGPIRIPVAAPVMMRRLAEGEHPELGEITPGKSCYDSYLNDLTSVTANDFARFVLAPETQLERRRSVAVRDLIASVSDAISPASKHDKTGP